MDVDAWNDARALKRRIRLQQVTWWEIAASVYTAIFVSLFILLSVNDAIGDEPVSAAGVDDIRKGGPAIIGACAALVLVAGARSGARGGPITPTPADVQWEWLGPAPREEVVRHGLRLALLGAMLAGGVAGAAAGVIAAGRLPGNALEWMALGATSLAFLAVATVAVAGLTAGLGAPPRLVELSVPLVGAVATMEAVSRTELLPTTWLGDVVLAPIDDVSYLGLVPIVAIPALVAVAWRVAPGVPLELIELRSRLVTELRFAIVTADVRAAVLLRRRLLQDRPRRTPWFPLPRLVPGAITRRSLHAALRWSWIRLAQLLVLAVVAGLAVAGHTAGTTPLIAVAALAMWAIGVDVCESLAADVEHEDQWSSSYLTLGGSRARHLLIAVVFALPPAFVMASVASAGSPQPLPVDPWLGLAVPAGMTAVVGGAITTMSSPRTMVAAVPEAAGSELLFRLASPVAVAGLGLAGVVGEAGTEGGRTLLALIVAVVVIGLALAIVALRPAARRGTERAFNQLARWRGGGAR